MHKELEAAIKNQNYNKICEFLHTKNYSSDSEWTTERCRDSFIQGFKEAENCYNIKDTLVVLEEYWMFRNFIESSKELENKFKQYMEASKNEKG